MPTADQEWAVPRLLPVARMAGTTGRAKPPDGSPAPPTYDELVAAGRKYVATWQRPDRYYEHEKERDTAAFLRRVMGISLRSVKAAHGQSRRPDAVWDAMRLTVDLKTPTSMSAARWSDLLADGAEKSDVVVFDSRAVPRQTRDQLLLKLKRAMGSHGRGERVDHVLLVGHTEGRDWMYWMKGGPQ